MRRNAEACQGEAHKKRISYSSRFGIAHLINSLPLCIQTTSRCSSIDCMAEMETGADVQVFPGSHPGETVDGTPPFHSPLVARAGSSMTYHGMRRNQRTTRPQAYKPPHILPPLPQHQVHLYQAVALCMRRYPVFRECRSESGTKFAKMVFVM